MFVFIGVAGIFLAMVISLSLVIWKQKKHIKKMEKKFNQYKDRVNVKDVKDSEPRHGFDY